MRAEPQTSAAPVLDDAWLRALAEHTSVAIFVFRQQFLYTNRAAQEITGYSAAELGGMQVLDLLHPDDRPAVQARLEARLRGDDVEPQAEFRILRKSGDEAWLTLSVAWLEHGGGRFAVGTAYDITARKRSEEALFQEKERAQVTLAAIADGVIRTDPGGHIDYLNPAAEQMTGWKLGSARGRELAAVFTAVDPTTRQPIEDPIARCLTGSASGAVGGQAVLLRADGEEFWVHYTAAAL
ncbi:MAG: PAS domain-containing protein, partial [Acidobacteriota bacterium]